MNWMQRRRAAMMGAKSEDTPLPLPDGYQEVEWIGTTSTGPHIQTSVSPEAGSIGYNITIQVNGSSKYASDWIGMRNGTDAGQQGFAIRGSVTSGYVSVQASNSSGSLSASTSETQLSYTPGDIVSIESEINYINDSSSTLTVKFTIGQNTETITKTGKLGTYINGAIKLFGDRTSIYAIGRFYGHAIVTNNSNEILHLVPCYRIADSVIGMYDLVAEAFYTNIGSGTFTKGDDV